MIESVTAAILAAPVPMRPRWSRANAVALAAGRGPPFQRWCQRPFQQGPGILRGVPKRLSIHRQRRKLMNTRRFVTLGVLNATLLVLAGSARADEASTAAQAARADI